MGWIFAFLFYLVSLLIGPLISSVISARYYDLADLETIHHQEVAAQQRLSWGDEAILDRERRAYSVAGHVRNVLDTKNWEAGTGGVADEATKGLSNLGSRMLGALFGDNGQAKWAAFMPTMTMRLEVFYLCYLLMLPMLIISYLLGAHWGRMAIRQGVHKREAKMRWILQGVRMFILVMIGLVGVPGMWPIVYWVGPAMAIIAAGYVWVRSSMIQPS